MRTNGHWDHTTVFDVPAHSLVHVTIYNFDGKSGLRNPFLSQVQGTVGGNMRVNGKPMDVIPPDGCLAHVHGAADGHLRPDRGRRQTTRRTSARRCPARSNKAHETITFTIRTGKPGRYRWQCFVPCAAGFIDGFAGPMQTIGYMDGFIHVI